MNKSGIGLGLMICKQLVQIIGGTIELNSDGDGKGTVVTFSFNAQAVADDDSFVTLDAELE